MNTRPPHDPRPCHAVSRALAAALREPQRPLAAPLKEHLSGCARCTREWSELLAVQRGLAATPGPSSEDLAEVRLRLRRSLAGSAPRRAPVPSTRIPAALRRAAGFVLMLALLTPVTAFWLERTPGGLLQRFGALSRRWSPSQWAARLSLPDLLPLLVSAPDP